MFPRSNEHRLSFILIKYTQIRHPFLTRTLITADKTFPKDVTIVEVGPRDGLQNEKVN